MSYYFIAQIKINDADEYQKFLDGYDEVFSQYNGEYLAVDGNPTVLEGEWDYTRTVLIRFSTEQDFRHWYESPEYPPLLANYGTNSLMLKYLFCKPQISLLSRKPYFMCVTEADTNSIKNVLKYEDEKVFEDSVNYMLSDPEARIEDIQQLTKVRRLNRAIGDSLKMFYD